MSKRKNSLTGLEFRQARSTRIIHIYDVIGYNRQKKPICGCDPGAVTYPLSPEDIGFINPEEKGRICSRCMNQYPVRTKKPRYACPRCGSRSDFPADPCMVCGFQGEGWIL
jgi:hypothetical protein